MQIEQRNGKWVALGADGSVLASSPNKYYLKQKIARGVDAVEEEEENVSLRFPINQRFDFLTRLVEMVGMGETASAIITGEGGLGKTHTVMQALHKAGLTDVSEIDPDEFETTPRRAFRVIKGYSTPKGLFKTLWENRNSIIVFDDCDSVLTNDDSVNLLKGALDTYDRRLITWNSSMRDEDIPRQFEFTGGVVFISNKAATSIDQAIRSRSMCVDVSMTIDQKIERMGAIMRGHSFMPGVALAHKEDALELIEQHADEAREISLRTLISVTKIRARGDADWRDLALYSLTAC